jgi:phage terminase large subunit GpA-like protein
MIRGLHYKSTLTSESEAKSKPYIGMHFSALYYPHATIRSLSQDWVKCLNSDSSKRVFWNKTLGEPFEITVSESSAADMHRCIVGPRVMPAGQEDQEAYRKGQVPAGVQFLTAGQDSRSIELHHAIWGWATVETTDGSSTRRGWLIDWGVTKKPYENALHVSDLRFFDQVIYQRLFPRRSSASSPTPEFLQVLSCGHDTGWQAEAVYAYCRTYPGRAVPVKGGAVSEGRDYETTGPILRWGDAPGYTAAGQIIRDLTMRPALLNTYQLKFELVGMAKRELKLASGVTSWALTFPMDVDDGFLTQLTNERLAKEHKNGRDVQVWKRKGPNHWLDCTVYALACALNQETVGIPSQTAAAVQTTGYVPGEDDGEEQRPVDPLLH